MKNFFILLAALLALNSASAQSCLPEGITFSTQQQINAFQTNYPGCRQIEGNVTISGYNIINLNGLSVVNSIGGSLSIVTNEALTNLTGLDNLTTIGGHLYLEGNMTLANLDGLHNVSYIGGDVQLTNNVSIMNLTGLEGLTAINGKLWINDNTALTSLTGLNNVLSVAGNVRIFSNPVLASLAGLENLTHIGGNLTIGGLGHLGGLGNLSLSSLVALSNVTSIGGVIDIGYNPVLPSLSGLDNIDAGSVTGLSVYENDTLSDCQVGSVCDYLAGPNSNTDINNNATGCNSVEEVVEECLLISLDQAKAVSTFTVYPNPSSGYITVEMPANRDILHLAVLDTRARELIRQEITGPETQVDVSRLAAGIYFLRISDDGTMMTKKLIRH